LLHFARFADRVAPGQPLTTDLALRWAQYGVAERPATAARRLVLLRPFAEYLRTVEPATIIPLPRLLGPAPSRPTPHIYTAAEIRGLFEAVDRLRSRRGLRRHSMRTYLGLLLSTGMRPQEPLRLARPDVDLAGHTLTVRRTKFGKSRLVVLHPTATAALRAYAQLRDRLVPITTSPAFFLGDDGRALTLTKARWAFNRLRRNLGWARWRPTRRLYDLRHTYVCRRLLAWHRTGVDVDVMMPALATYLGHVKVTDTYWYVTAVPGLLQHVGARFERRLRETRGGAR
jgi:integrase